MKKVMPLLVVVVLLFVGALFYQFYGASKRVEISSTSAQATAPSQKSDGPLEEAQPRVSVKISQEFPAQRSKIFRLSTYLNMKVEFSATEGDKVIVSLIGEGEGYKNDGQRLADWFQVSSSGQTLRLKSFEKKGFKGFDSVKALAKSLQEKDKDRESFSDLTMVVEYPENFEFQKIHLETVTSDIFAKGLHFEDFQMATVSGDLRLQDSFGKNLKVESVSGNSHLQVANLKSVDMGSVSGDVTLETTTESPRLKFASVSGNLKLKIPKDSKVNVSFESMTGELINDFANSRSGGQSLKFSSLSGSAQIIKQ